MNIRHLSYFVALAREKHHGRAAAACNVTQSTLSEAVRQLERELRFPLVKRQGQRYGGLTAEGKATLTWAERIIADQIALEKELLQLHGELSGQLRFGVIPAAMPTIPFLTGPFCRNYPSVTFQILSCTSVEIQQGIETGTMEAGLTYLENEPIKNVRTHPLYDERYMLLTPRSSRFNGLTSIAWREAAQLPLCLLTPDMQNRRIIDRLFQESGSDKPRVTIETNSVSALVAHVRSGGWSSVVPHTFLPLLGQKNVTLGEVLAIPLVKPSASQSVGLVVNERDPLSPLARALLKQAHSIDVRRELQRRVTWRAG